MARKHGAKQQKKLAKQKAKRQAKRTVLARRSSKDPTVRLQQTEKWPVVQALVSTGLWEEGIGYLVLAREDPDGGTVFASYLVDVFCLGVKDCFWEAGTREEYRNMIERMEEVQDLSPIKPACLVKIITGAVEFADSFGFSPHPDFRHASLLLAGIDPSTCREEYTFGRDGKPFYIQGPNESRGQAMAIAERVREAGGHYVAVASGEDLEDLEGLEALEEDLDEDDGADRPGWTWEGPGPGGRR